MDRARDVNNDTKPPDDELRPRARPDRSITSARRPPSAGDALAEDILGGGLRLGDVLLGDGDVAHHALLLDEHDVLRLDGLDELLPAAGRLRLRHAQLHGADDDHDVDERRQRDVLRVGDGLHNDRVAHIEHERGRRLHGRDDGLDERVRRGRAPRKGRPGRRGHLAEHRAAEGEGGQDVQEELHAREAALLVHLADHDGDTEQPAEDAHAVRDLPVHHGPVPVLPAEPAAVAELDQALALVQRLLREGAAHPRQAGQGLLLVPAPRLREHVLERLLPAPPEALQGREEGDPAAGAQEPLARRHQ